MTNDQARSEVLSTEYSEQSAVNRPSVRSLVFIGHWDLVIGT